MLITSEKPALYSYFRSSCSVRVRIALNLKNIDYVNIPVHLLKDEHKTEEYKKHNPNALVPTLIIDGHVLTQSMAILEYLEEKYPDVSPLLPKDIVDRAKVRALAQIIAADIQPATNLRVLQKIGETKVEWANHFINLGFEALEKELESTAGKYAYGDQITFIDLCIYPQVYNAQRFKVDMSKFPIIQKIYDNLEGLDPFIKADWKNQPDTPEEFRV